MFYRDIASTVDIRVARCYPRASGTEDAATSCCVLEDLSPGAQGDQITGCTVPNRPHGGLELARLHGPRWDDPTLDDIEWLGRRTGPDDGCALSELWAMFAARLPRPPTRSTCDADAVELHRAVRRAHRRVGRRARRPDDGDARRLPARQPDVRLRATAATRSRRSTGRRPGTVRRSATSATSWAPACCPASVARSSVSCVDRYCAGARPTTASTSTTTGCGTTTVATPSPASS